MATANGKLKKRRSAYSKRDMMGLVYIMPWIVGLLVFQLFPFGYSLVLSFTNRTMSPYVSFIGFQNYVHIFTRDRDFWNVAGITIRYVLMSVPGRVLFALIVALLLQKEMKGVNFFRTLYYLPSIFGGSVAIAIVWRFLFMREGFINQLLSTVGLSPINWLGDPNVALYTVALIPIWQFGSSMVLFLAALKNVPITLYEAARIDGGGRIKIFFKITLPMISPIILFNVIMQTVGTFQEFAMPFNVFGGGGRGPNNSVFLYGVKLYMEAFTNFRMGYASALSWIFFIFILFVTMIIFLSSRYWAFYEDGRDS